MAEVTIKVELAGGLDLLFDNKPTLQVTLPSSGVSDSGTPIIKVGELISHMATIMDDSRSELFIIEGHIRPGIMVLVNEADWELEGEEDCEVSNGDEVLFVSTLHGG